MLLRNAHSSWLLYWIIKNSVTHFINPNMKLGPQKDRLYIGMPFLGKSIDRLRKSIKEICKQFIPHKDVIIIIIYFKPGRRVLNFFALRIVRLLRCVLVSCTNIRALNVNAAASGK